MHTPYNGKRGPAWSTLVIRSHDCSRHTQLKPAALVGIWQRRDLCTCSSYLSSTAAVWLYVAALCSHGDTGIRISTFWHQTACILSLRSPKSRYGSSSSPSFWRNTSNSFSCKVPTHHIAPPAGSYALLAPSTPLSSNLMHAVHTHSGQGVMPQQPSSPRVAFPPGLNSSSSSTGSTSQGPMLPVAAVFSPQLQPATTLSPSAVQYRVVVTCHHHKHHHQHSTW